jgi:hypothetical protein
MFGEYTRMLFGDQAVYAKTHLIVQKGDNEGHTVAIAALSRSEGQHPLLFGSTKTHQLVVGELIVVPKLVMESNHLQGSGMSHMFTFGLGDAEGWQEHGSVRFIRDQRKVDILGHLF